LFRYLKYYFELKHKALEELAVESARKYFATHPKNTNYDFAAYTRGFINGYRAAYATAMKEKYDEATLAVQKRLLK
jgi:outer membrane protein assembly factor BamD (BamD/ComL family)